MVVAAIRVMIVDDQPVTREGVHAALDLANDDVVVGEADSGENAVEEAGKLTPDIVFMDVRMPGKSGIDERPIRLREGAHGRERGRQPVPAGGHLVDGRRRTHAQRFGGYT